VYFEKKRPMENRLNRHYGGVKALDVAHLQNALAPPRSFEKCVRLRETNGHGLFDQHIQTAFQKLATHFGVRDGGHRYADGIRKLVDFSKTA
jgi:hypothetical protein